MRNFVLFFLLINPISKADEGFYPAQKVPRDEVIGNFRIALSSTLPIIIITAQDPSPGTCTGTFISNDGYLVTALHCISRCLYNFGKMDSIKNPFPQYDIEMVKLPITNLHCDLIYNGYLTVAQVVLAGNGYSFFDESQINNYDDDTKKLFFDFNEDFAILKLNIQKPVACLKRGTKPCPGRKVWQIGYPKQSFRSHTSNSGANEKSISFGNVYANYTENPPLNKRIKAWGTKANEYLSAYFSDDKFILTNTDTLPGSSGSPLLDISGNLLGVTSVLLTEDPNRQVLEYVEPLILHVSSQFIFQKAQSELGEVKAKEIFNCY